MKLPPLAYVAIGGLMGVIGVGLWKASNPPREAALVLRPSGTPGVVFGTNLSGSTPPVANNTGLVEKDATITAPAPVRPGTARAEGLADIENIQLMFRDFRTRMAGNPVGTNAEIMRSVMGGNSAQAKLGPPEGQTVNEQGELVDRWGTPYFFHQLSRDQMEIRSAGPDRAMWTTDDIVIR